MGTSTTTGTATQGPRQGTSRRGPPARPATGSRGGGRRSRLFRLPAALNGRRLGHHRVVRWAPIMADVLDTARAAGSAVAMATNATILLTAPDRYAIWVAHVGGELARIRVVDALSRLSAWLRRLGAEADHLGHAWLELEDPTLALLREVVRWDGAGPVPAPIVGTAESALPCFGVQATIFSFDPTEAPTLPLLHDLVDPLAALEDEHLLDDRSELYVVIRRIVQRSGLTDAVIAFRGGDLVIRASEPPPTTAPTAPAFDAADSTPHVGDVLERTDLTLEVSLGGTPVAIRLSGPRLLLVATATARESLEVLKGSSLGPTLDLLLQGLEDRVERTSFPPWLADSPAHGRFAR